MVGNFSLSSSKFRRKLGRLEVEDREIGEEWREMEEKINRVLREMEGGKELESRRRRGSGMSAKNKKRSKERTKEIDK